MVPDLRLLLPVVAVVAKFAWVVAPVVVGLLVVPLVGPVREKV